MQQISLSASHGRFFVEVHHEHFLRTSLAYGRKRIAQSEFSAVRSLMSSTKDEFNEAEHLAGNLMAHVFIRERAAIGSSVVFARSAKARTDVLGVVSALEVDEAATRKKIDEAAEERADELGVMRSARTLTEADRRTARFIPAWNAGKELFSFDYVKRILAKDATAQIPKIDAALDEVSQRLRDQGIDELTLYGFQDAPTLYVDGKRSIMDIRDALAAEYTSI